MNGLLAHAILAFLALPGVVAFLVPLLIRDPAPEREPFTTVAYAPLLLGVVLLLWCVRDFYVMGKGTLAPWAPPRELVVMGLYRHVRNPMYIAVILILIGWAVGFRSRSHAVYAAVVVVVFHIRVVFWEEPFLARTHGDRWTTYRDRVPRWVPAIGRLRDVT